MDPACNTEENEKCFETPRVIGSSEFDLDAVGQPEVLTQYKVNRYYFFGAYFPVWMREVQ